MTRAWKKGIGKVVATEQKTQEADYKKLEEDIALWRDTAIEATGKLKEQDVILQKLREPPRIYATLLEVKDSLATVSLPNRATYQVGFNPQLQGRLNRGNAVVLHPESYLIMDVAPGHTQRHIGKVEKVYDKERVKVSCGGTEVLLSNSGMDLKAGDSVALDPSLHLILERLERDKSPFYLENVSEVSWNNIGGLDGAIRTIKESIELPYRYPELYKKYNRRPPKGVLLYGPPGCGKTLLAKATAYNLSNHKNNGKGANGTYFFSVKGPELLNEYVGVSERNIRELFDKAREKGKENGSPAVIFFDEAESLLHPRGSGNASELRDSVVAQFLTELDGMEPLKNVVVILASNRADRIDPAVLRPGRIDRKVKIPRPNKQGIQSIFEIYLKDVPFAGQKCDCPAMKYQDVAKRISDQLCAPQNIFLEIHYRDGQKGFASYKDATSGALIESIVERAKGKAIQREIKKKGEGIGYQDIVEAMHEEYRENKDLVHTLTPDDMQNIAGDRYNQVTSIVPYKPSNGVSAKKVV